MKTNKFILTGAIVLIIALITKIVVNEYEIREYKLQIEDLRQVIKYNVVADSLLGVKTDSTGKQYYVLGKDDKGNIMTYRDAVKTIEAQDHVIQLQDIVIRKAKKQYNFNYSVKDSCGVAIVKFWNK